jgi:uncharacterized protein YkwD|tara:strand:- start:27 stop:404 length:378 start_codon:yes stop_codon:yes gene_type:complete
MENRFPNLSDLIDLHNEARKKGWFVLDSLENDNDLENYATMWANKMAENHKLKHSSMKDILALGFNKVSENIAYGQKDEESVMKTWLNSSGHKRNIMDKNITHIGCGFSYSSDNVLYWCVCFGRK